MEQITVSLNYEDAMRLNRMAVLDDRSQSSICRRALLPVLAKWEQSEYGEDVPSIAEWVQSQIAKTG